MCLLQISMLAVLLLRRTSNVLPRRLHAPATQPGGGAAGIPREPVVGTVIPLRRMPTDRVHVLANWTDILVTSRKCLSQTRSYNLSIRTFPT